MKPRSALPIVEVMSEIASEDVAPTELQARFGTSSCVVERWEYNDGTTWQPVHSSVTGPPAGLLIVRSGRVEQWRREPGRWVLSTVLDRRSTVAQLRRILRLDSIELETLDGVPGPPPLGLIGVFGYELGHIWEPLDVHSSRAVATEGVDGIWYAVDHGVTLCHLSNNCFTWSLGASRTSLSPDRERALQQQAWLRRRLRSSLTSCKRRECRVSTIKGFKTGIDPTIYRDRIATVLRSIGRGDIYQACFTFPVYPETTEVNGDSHVDGPTISIRDLFRSLRVGAPFAAHMSFAVPPAGVNVASDEECGRLDLVSASPERFMSIRGRRVLCSPMKGTRERRAGEGRPGRGARILVESVKDRAENVMITDLVRNDLGRVCEPGSVTVSDLFAVDSLPTVHQMSSHVEGVLRQEHDSLDAIQAAFPPGSMTGAPRIRAREILAEVEPWSRGLYSGAMGVLRFDGSVDLSVVIRTLVSSEQPGRQSTSYWGVGGGIVADSNPDEEWKEAMAKMRALADAFGVAEDGSTTNGDVLGIPCNV